MSRPVLTPHHRTSLRLRTAVVCAAFSLCSCAGEFLHPNTDESERVRTRCSHLKEAAAQAKETLANHSEHLYIPGALRRFIPSKDSEPDQFVEKLCAVFADSPDAAEARLKALAKVHRPREGVLQTFDSEQPLFHQLTAEGYRELVHLSRTLSSFRTKKPDLRQPSIFHVTNGSPPTPLSVCETKFIFDRYLARQRSVEDEEDFAQYLDEYSEFESTHCKSSETSEVFLFRGDSGFVPNMYEARVMSISQHRGISSCLKREQTEEETCRRFQKMPFTFRSEEAQLLFRSLLFYPRGFEEVGSNERENIFFLEGKREPLHWPFYFFRTDSPEEKAGEKATRQLQRALKEADGVKSSEFREHLRELSSLLQQGDEDLKGGVLGVSGTLWKPSFQRLDDLGFSKVFQIATAGGKQEGWNRLSTIFDRHVYYYRTSYLNSEAMFYTNRFSPWVSASAFPHQSHKFTAKGYNRGRLHEMSLVWLSVFRVKRDNLYSAEDLFRGESFNLQSDWFHEQSFGTHSLSQKEMAFNFFAAPAPETIDSILLLDQVTLTPEMAVLLLP